MWTLAPRVFIHDWNSTNPPMKHIVFDGTDSDITVQNTTNTAPYPSPNTDCLNLQGNQLPHPELRLPWRG